MNHKHRPVSGNSQMLREKGFRVTKGRLELLALLEESGQPLSIKKILSQWKGRAPDTVTIYRSLTDLSSAGIVRRIDLNTGVAHFEYTPDRPHHHHIVCEDCGIIEEIDGCSVDVLQNKITKVSKMFRNITNHNLEFFGHCAKCSTV
jgi:Fur family transcriptional regulator, ferric uptake regulator